MDLNIIMAYITLAVIVYVLYDVTTDHSYNKQEVIMNLARERYSYYEYKQCEGEVDFENIFKRFRN